ncbi:MAG: hypothetical protein KTR20_04620, partial [Cellvibrionaceae bacterium]|nr:hypothetical protein [Cellvibrionaceae bacterium]
SEPMPQGSYYFMIFDTKGHVLLSGYSDNAVYVENIDNDAYDEVIVGVNTENTDPLEYLLDYLPYPVVYDWNRSGKLELQSSNQYKSLFEKYMLDQKEYKQALKVKIEEQKQYQRNH